MRAIILDIVIILTLVDSSQCARTSCKIRALSNWFKEYRTERQKMKRLKLKKSALKDAEEKSGHNFFNEWPSFQYDKDICLALVATDGMSIQYIMDSRLRNDFDVVLTAVHNNGYVLDLLEFYYKMNKTVVSTAVKQNGRALSYAHATFKRDKRIVLLALQSDPVAITAVSPRLFGDPARFIFFQF